LPDARGITAVAAALFLLSAAAAAGAGIRGSFDGPLAYSAEVPDEGNYRVEVTLEGPSETTIKAELRRLMAERLRVEEGRRKSGRVYRQRPPAAVPRRRGSAEGAGENLRSRSLGQPHLA